MQCKQCPVRENGKLPFGNAAKVLGAVALVGILGTGAVMAKGFGDHDRHGKSGMMEELELSEAMMEELELSEAQEEKIEGIQKQFRKQMRQQRMQKKGQNPLQLALKDGKFDKAAFMKASSEQHQVKTEQMAEHFESVLAVLNDSQKKELATILEQNRNCKSR